MPIPKKLVAPENAIARIEGAAGAAAPSTPWHFSINVGAGGGCWSSSSSTWYLGALWDTHRRLRDPEAATRARARPNMLLAIQVENAFRDVRSASRANIEA